MINSSTKKSENNGVELRIQGIVQGVGFRPFIYNLATQLKISGTVSNTSAGVFIRAVADSSTLEIFISRIHTEAPPLAQILALDVVPFDPALLSSSDFHILASEAGSSSSTAIPPDIAVCSDCLDELISPDDKRYGYPFINCTNCGPRFTIVETIPYDRPKTSMKVFPMCPDCTTEYNDPADRRFHAQPNACPRCGPQISWHDAAGNLLSRDNPVWEATAALQQGKIIAMRGLGGFHLVVDGCSEEGVATLRRRKNRPTKPLAIMVKDMTAVEKLCIIGAHEKEELDSPQHSIVLLEKRENDATLAPNLSPGVCDLGIMLPYTPLHHLLFQEEDCPAALVMTSGNVSGRPICISNQSALSELNEIADFFLLHNREILTRVDDSVTKKLNHKMRLFRRARGYSPSPLLLAHSLPQVLGCGGGLKSTFSLGRNNLAFVSQHIGDLFNLESFDFYIESINHYKRVFEIEPELVVRDLHPDYMSSHFAEEQGLPVYTAQHHHAHAVAVMAEHHISEEVLSVILDGTGYGTDGTVWGGEILLNDLTGFQRLGHLQPLSLPGGDKAAEEPWRMALSALYHTFGREWLSEKNLPPLLRTVNPSQRQIILEMVENGFNAPLTSSCGRLFDAVAALLDLRLKSDYEGHAAMELEAAAMKALLPGWKEQLNMTMALPSTFSTFDAGKWEIISSEFVKVILVKRRQGFTASQIALDFHFELICAISKLVKTLSIQHNTDKIVLSGGCMQNRLLMEGLFHTLEREELQVFSGEKVPVNDGGISFGQILIGGLQHVSRNSHEGDQGGRQS
ncbi:carbamoyltransferase HypF [Desulfopila inferna]|uniref:carbamoyltransferase HypF n=1 Tax=Desulfopila inferna TaxID=468528 RepID=UPI001966A4B1|nr:carbamoyltransferase HypF [Desulfopila inferna]